MVYLIFRTKYFLIYYLAANNKTELPANLVLLPKIIYFMTLLEE